MNAKLIANKARKQLKLLKADKFDSQVNLTAHHDGSAHIEDLPNNKFRYVYSERGKEYDEKITNNYNDVLYWIYVDATSSMACKWELKNRIKGQDSRILIFNKQLELLSLIKKDFTYRRKEEIKEILKNNPFK